MNTEEAKKCVMNGGIVRNKLWNAEEYIKRCSGGGLISESGQRYSFNFWFGDGHEKSKWTGIQEGFAKDHSIPKPDNGSTGDYIDGFDTGKLIQESRVSSLDYFRGKMGV